MLEQGVPLEAVTETLGHSSLQITKDIYAPYVPRLRDEATRAMGELLA